MFYQFLTAVVFDMCLQDFMTDRSGIKLGVQK